MFDDLSNSRFSPSRDLSSSFSRQMAVRIKTLHFASSNEIEKSLCDRYLYKVTCIFQNTIWIADWRWSAIILHRRRRIWCHWTWNTKGSGWSLTLTGWASVQLGTFQAVFLFLESLLSSCTATAFSLDRKETTLWFVRWPLQSLLSPMTCSSYFCACAAGFCISAHLDLKIENMCFCMIDFWRLKIEFCSRKSITNVVSLPSQIHLFLSSVWLWEPLLLESSVLFRFEPLSIDGTSLLDPTSIHCVY